jgi:hypothetical protein
MYFADQFAGFRLTSAGLIAAATESGRALLTASGRAGGDRARCMLG